MPISEYAGKWRYRFKLNGHPYQQRGFDSKWQAQRAEDQKLKELGALGDLRPRPGRRQGRTLSECLDEYIDEAVRRRPNAANEEYALKLVQQKLGLKGVSQVTAADVQALKKWRAGQTWCRRHGKADCADDKQLPCEHARSVSPATVNRTLAYLQGFFTWAQQRGYVPEGYNPASSLRVERDEETWRPWVILTPEQEVKLYAAMGARQALKAQLLKNLGVRMGVIINLEWERVDWPSRLVTYHSKGKSGVIPLNQTAYDLLHAHWESEGKPQRGRVFTERSLTSLKRHWDRARVAIGLPKLRRHDLRVTFARQLHDHGAPLKTIQGLLGHSSITMTTRYIPPDLEAQRRAVKLLDPQQKGK